jgi:hypothetical protein
MQLKKYIWIPQEHITSSESVARWIFNSDEQGGVYDSIESAQEQSKEYLKKGFKLYTLNIVVGPEVDEY